MPLQSRDLSYNKVANPNALPWILFNCSQLRLLNSMGNRVSGKVLVFGCVRLDHLDFSANNFPVYITDFNASALQLQFRTCRTAAQELLNKFCSIGAMSGHASWVLSVDASRDGAAIASGSSNRTVWLWDLNMRATVQTMTDHTDQAWDVWFRPPDGTGVRAGQFGTFTEMDSWRKPTSTYSVGRVVNTGS